MNLSDEDLQRLHAQVAAEAEDGNAWSAATNVLRNQHPHVVGALAHKYLVDTYFRHRRDFEMTLDEMTEPLRVKPKKQRGERTPSSARSRLDIDARLFADLKRAADIFEREIRAKWDAELLAETFAGRDGRTVTWSDATIEDHQAAVQDAAAHMGLAAAKHAAHTKAIEDLSAAGATSLADLVKVAA